MLAARHGGDDRSLPQQDAGGSRPRYDLQRPEGVRSVRIDRAKRAENRRLLIIASQNKRDSKL